MYNSIIILFLNHCSCDLQHRISKFWQDNKYLSIQTIHCPGHPCSQSRHWEHKSPLLCLAECPVLVSSTRREKVFQETSVMLDFSQLTRDSRWWPELPYVVTIAHTDSTVVSVQCIGQQLVFGHPTDKMWQSVLCFTFVCFLCVQQPKSEWPFLDPLLTCHEEWFISRPTSWFLLKMTSGNLAIRVWSACNLKTFNCIYPSGAEYNNRIANIFLRHRKIRNWISTSGTLSYRCPYQLNIMLVILMVLM